MTEDEFDEKVTSLLDEMGDLFGRKVVGLVLKTEFLNDLLDKAYEAGVMEED